MFYVKREKKKGAVKEKHSFFLPSPSLSLYVDPNKHRSQHEEEEEKKKEAKNDE
jgi:hypothetical protein